MYKIVNFDVSTASVTLEFDADVPSIVVQLPIDHNGNVPTGNDLDFYLSGFVPVWELDRRKAVAAGIGNADAIKQLIQEPTKPENMPQKFIDPILDVGIELAKKTAKEQIDKAASACRSLFISTGVGQEATYILKNQQAQAFKDSGYTGVVPPFINAEATACGLTPQEVADKILFMTDIWQNNIGPMIEANRVGGKQAIDLQDTNQGVDDVLRLWAEKIHNIRPAT